MWQFEWRGATLQNIKILVCRDCIDTPQENIRSIVIPADPTPIVNARIQDFVAASTDELSLAAAPVIDPITGIPRPVNISLSTQNGNTLTTQPIGPNPNNVGDGLTQAAIMPQFQKTAYGVVLPVLSVVAAAQSIINVTCSAPHGLSTGNLISAQGLSNNAANGFYSVTVVTATLFSYQTSQITTLSGSLYTPRTRIVTAYLTLPYGYDQIPQTGT